MKTLQVRLKSKFDHSYPIHVGDGALALLPDILHRSPQTGKIALVADANAERLHGDAVKATLADSSRHWFSVTVPSGEVHKTRQTKAMIEDRLFEEGLDRKGLIIAFGGGVTGDLAGFIAATFMRGIPFIQIPTTLLSQVDSSVGGKTGLDVPAGKNLIGAFQQPLAVLIEPAFLDTLEDGEYLSGLGEVLKHALLFSPALYSTLLNERDAVLSRDRGLLTRMIAENCALKAQVVERDTKESEYRKTLNLGHTAAHALELVSGFQVKHGIAVLHGLCLEACIAEVAGIAAPQTTDSIFTLIDQYLPESFRFSGLRDPSLDERIVDNMLTDKKNRDGRIFFSFINETGKPFTTDGCFAHSVERERILAGLRLFRTRFFKN